MQDVIQAMAVFQLVTIAVIVCLFLYLQYQLKRERFERSKDRQDIEDLSQYIRHQGDTNRKLREAMVKREIAISMILESMQALRHKAKVTQVDLDYIEQKLKETLEGIND